MRSRTKKFISYGMTMAGGLALALSGVANAQEMSALDKLEDAISALCSPELYTPKPNDGAKKQIVDLVRAHKFADAIEIGEMVTTPQAVWFTQGTPRSVEHDVHVVVSRARNRGVPQLVAYNIPFRDCAQFSAGGATNAAEYAAWVDGFAKGIGNSPAIVILEPDSLGIIPWFTPYFASGPDWCQPAEANPATAADERFAMIKAAVTRLKQQPNVKIYLDATNAWWLGVGEATHRLILAGVDQTAGFYLNVSNYASTVNSTDYGTWISDCIARTQGVPGWDASWCKGQYAPDATGTYVVDFSEANVQAVYADFSWGPQGATHFVIDTSRNGQDVWTAPAGHPAGDPQVWCNPPGRGLGLRPTLHTGKPLVDAYLWVKIPGESDGACNRWSPAGSIDPVRGIMDPEAGKWFSDMALELVHNAVPAI